MLDFTPVHPVFRNGRLYESAEDVDYWPWTAISPDQWRMNDRITGNVFVDDRSMGALQTVADLLGKDRIHVNSGHRGPELNKQVGGAKNSAHLNIAFDVPLTNALNPLDLLDAAVFAGFTSFGLYRSFIHMDVRPGTNGRPTRLWYGTGAAPMWVALGVKDRSYVTLS